MMCLSIDKDTSPDRFTIPPIHYLLDTTLAAPYKAHAVPPSIRTTTTPTEIEATPRQTYRDRAQTHHLLEGRH